MVRAECVRKLGLLRSPGDLVRSLPEPTAVSLAATRDWALRRLAEDLSIPRLAAHARVSPRTLTRMWRQETGASPRQWLPAVTPAEVSSGSLSR